MVTAHTPAPAAKQCPVRGTVYYLLFGVFATLHIITTKVLYEKNPDMSVWNLLFICSIVICSILLLYVNVSFKKVMYDDLDRESMPCLAFRIFECVVSATIFNTCLKLLPVSTVAVMVKTTPMLVFVIAYFVLGEHVTRMDTFSLLLGLSGTIILVICTNGKEGDPVGERHSWLYVTLAANIFLMAYSEV